MTKDKVDPFVMLPVTEYEELKGAQHFLNDFENKLRHLVKKVAENAEVSLYAEFQTRKSDAENGVSFAVRVLEEKALKAIVDDYNYLLEKEVKGIRESEEWKLGNLQDRVEHYEKKLKDLQERIDKYNKSGFIHKIFNDV